MLDHIRLSCVTTKPCFHSKHNAIPNYISEFPGQCESKEFPCEMYETSYTMENSFREARLGDVSLDSDINMHKAHYDK